MKAEKVNELLKRLGLRVRVKGSPTLVREIGLRKEYTWRTTRGALLYFNVINQEETQKIVSILKVKDKRRPFFVLCNGQASRNCYDLAYFGEYEAVPV